MEVVYSWILSQGCLETAPSLDGLTDVVVKVNWRRSATTVVDGKNYYTDVYGQMACTTPSPTDFTAYPDLTEAQVESWLDAGLDFPALDLNLYNSLENLINPPIIVLPNPWIPTTTTTTTEAPHTTTTTSSL